jgi:hypothetical protein
MRKKWDSRMQFGLCRRSKIAKKASGCNSIDGMVRIKKAEDCNTRVKTDNFNLDEMSTYAILSFANLKSITTREKVFSIIKEAIIKDIDPFTKGPLGYSGVTQPMVNDLIGLVTTGKVSPKTKRKAMGLTTKEIDTLDNMRVISISASKTSEEREAILQLYKKIRGIQPIGQAKA